MPCISGTLFPLSLYLELMSALRNPTHLAQQQTTQHPNLFQIRNESNWFGRQQKLESCLRLLAQTSGRERLGMLPEDTELNLKAPNAKSYSKGFPRTDSNTRKCRGWYLHHSFCSFSWLPTKNDVGWCSETITQKQHSTLQRAFPVAEPQALHNQDNQQVPCLVDYLLCP